MALAGLFNIPEDDVGLLRFSFSNADSHTRIIRAIFLARNVNLETFPLDPINKQDIKSWLRRHQTMHNDMNTFFGLSGDDLTDVDFEKREQLAEWIWIHAVEHRNAHFALGI